MTSSSLTVKPSFSVAAVLLTEMKQLQLIFIPTPLIGHLSSAVQLANILVDRDHRLSITILVIKLPVPTKSAPLIESLCTSSATQRIRFITLPEQPLPDGTKNTLVLKAIVESQKLHVAEAVTKLAASPPLAGFVVDMFCISMIDVANEFGVPTFVFFTCSAAYLALLFHLQQLYDDRHNKDMDELLNSATEFAVPGFANPIPGKIISTIFFDKDGNEGIHENTRRFREARGILVNTFSELEPNVMDWFSNGGRTGRFPPVYAVGPILNLRKSSSVAPSGSGATPENDDILKWLDEQPPSSVVFLCFGSMGSFKEDQTKEIADALERSGVRFLWSLRQPPPNHKQGSLNDHASTETILPEGFLDRIAGMGKVIGWSPQVEILEHRATRGFVTHCGWNSTLESLWYSVAMAAWPMYAEQQFNAFQMVVELGLAVEISLDYNMKEYNTEQGLILRAEKIESGIRKLMDGSASDELRKAATVKSEESKKATMEGGSSFTALNRFIDAFVANSS